MGPDGEDDVNDLKPKPVPKDLWEHIRKETPNIH